VQELS